MRKPLRARGPAWLLLAQAVAPLLLWYPVARTISVVAPVRFDADLAVQPWSLLLHAALFAPAMTMVVVLVLRFTQHDLTDLGLRRPRPGWVRGIVLGAAIGAAISFAMQPVEHLLGASGFTWNGQAFGERMPTSDWIAWSLSGVILGGFTEELVFRGVALQRLEGLLGRALQPTVAFAIAALFVALEFGRRHLYQGSLGFVTVALLGLALAAVYLLSGRSLTITMAAHAAIDVTRLTQIWLAAASPALAE